jgi:hypothetical protein
MKGVESNSVHSALRSLIGLLYPPRVIMMQNWWNDDWQGKQKYLEKTCPSVALSNTKPTCCPDANPGSRGGKSATTNRLSKGTASAIKLQCLIFYTTQIIFTKFGIKYTLPIVRRFSFGSCKTMVTPNLRSCHSWSGKSLPSNCCGPGSLPCRARGVCDGQMELGQVFSEYFGSLINHHSTNFSIIIITRGWHHRPMVAAVPSGANWTPPPHYSILKKIYVTYMLTFTDVFNSRIFIKLCKFHKIYFYCYYLNHFSILTSQLR